MLPLGLDDPALPEGFRYRPYVLPPADEARLVERLHALPLREFEFHGFTARRRTISFGWHYDFGHARLEEAEPIPDWLLPLRETVAAFADLPAERLSHVLILEYGHGALTLCPSISRPDASTTAASSWSVPARSTSGAPGVTAIAAGTRGPRSSPQASTIAGTSQAPEEAEPRHGAPAATHITRLSASHDR